MKEKEDEYSFKCWKCTLETKYTITDLFDSKTELLIERVSYNTPINNDYFLDCKHCGAKNKIILD